jgi:hypothetical protein
MTIVNPSPLEPTWEVLMRRWLVTLALSLSLASAAHAGGLHGRIEGPGPDGVTYTARMIGLHDGDALQPWALAEGAVDGKRRSVLIRLEPTSEPGVYTFARTWPKDGTWMIRLSLGHPPAPATVASLRADGSVKSNKLHYKTDGFPECSLALRKFLKFDPNSEDNC